ncbi:ATP-dependent DNA helicase [Haliscomenobacter hydrossis]|uniref:AAA ATPase n=1 Tax=Haliscomenobacter hydrossis (strain ATCC 27775 / DSM 1100 / LMG 10767 / O) TaxID=760192 RepID=F4L001_HALH1|nr:DEAD/DEAH box helicase [Haliscomenobacter hydrossis]AEE51571.1 AAA ATPase [Haliscomenobacter hydrossis DSM 1100]
MNIHHHFPNLQLTQDQQTTLGQVEAFLEGGDQIFLLKGYAGTGKTTLLHGICRYLAAKQSDFRLMAPTGRAAMILARKTAIKSCTIHRGIYNMDQLEEKEEGTSFKFFYALKTNEDSSRCVYLVDEASMVSDVYSDDEFFTFGSGLLLKDLITYTLQGENHHKIIFVGDDAQLPPVNMPFSPALETHYLQNQYGLQVQTAQLTQVVRQAHQSGILTTATYLRQAIAANKFNAFSIHTQYNDVHTIQPEQVVEEYVSMVKQQGIQNTIIITHSNRQALEYNQLIRQRRYGENGSQLQKEDILLITRNNYNGSLELFNGMFARVLEVGGIEYTASPRFKIEGGTTIQRELVFRSLRVEITAIDGSIHQLKTTVLDPFLTASEGKLHPYDQRALYIDFKMRAIAKGLHPKSEAFREALKKDVYFNALQAKYGYAITCHKSQGGEWTGVLVDFKVFIGKLSSSFFRWSYTAITRSSKALLCIDAPNYNALSEFVVHDITKLGKVLPESYYVPDGLNFLEYRKSRLQQICQRQELTMLIVEHSYQLEVGFQQGNESGKVQLWYTKTGFSSVTWVTFSSPEFKNLIDELLIESLLPESIPFVPKFDFQKDLHLYFLEILSECNLPLTNVVQREWSDLYCIRTDADCAAVEFFFNGNHMYTFAIPKSTAGADDVKLQEVINKLRGL